MKKIFVFLITVVLFMPYCLFAEEKTIPYYNLYDVPVTDEMKDFVYKTCNEKIYCVSEGHSIVNGVNFNETTLTLDVAKKLRAPVVIIKTNVYRAVKLYQSNYYGIYFRNSGMNFSKEDIIELIEGEYLFKKNGFLLKVDDYIKQYGGNKEDRINYLRDKFINDTCVLIAEKTSNGFEYINSSIWTDPDIDIGNYSFLMFNKVEKTKLDEMEDKAPQKYAEYFRTLMVEIIDKKTITKNDTIFVETTKMK